MPQPEFSFTPFTPKGGQVDLNDLVSFVNRELTKLSRMVRGPVAVDLGTRTADTLIDLHLYDLVFLPAGADLTISLSRQVRTGARAVIVLKQDGTGGRVVTWEGVTWNAGAAPALRTTAEVSYALEFVFTPDGTWQGSVGSVTRLSEITDDVGEVVSGLLRNSASTRVIRLDSADAIPGTAETFIDLDAVDADDPVLLLANGMLVLTKAGDLRLEGTAALDTLTVPTTGSATIDGPTLIRALLQSSAAGSALGAGARAELRDGSLVVRQDSAGNEQTQAVLGTFSRTTGGLTDRTANTWSGASGSATTNLRNTYVEDTAPEITLNATLPAYDGIYRFSGEVTAEVTIAGTQFQYVDANVRCYYTIDGGTEQDFGIIGSVRSFAGAQTLAFNAVLSAPGVTTSLKIRLAIEVFVADDGSGSDRSTGVATVDTLSSVAWKQNASGTVVTRRGLFLGAEAGKPQICPEPLAADPSTANLVEGEMWYNSTDHKWKFFDGTNIVSMT